ncbi:MAG: hypothetical protein KBT47_07305 [Armatimonadetes bacterium]|nr:hypothetical protein [Candidatus Hippobium faecium]
MKKILFLVIILLAFSACVYSAELQKMMFPDQGIWGVSIHEPGMIKNEIGVQWCRYDIFWPYIEAEEGKFDFTEEDKALECFKSQGIKPFFIFNCGIIPDWYKLDKNNLDDLYEHIEIFAKEVAKHYKNEVDIIWELGNEPETFHLGDVWNKPENYVRYARLVAKDLKAVQPKWKTGACSVAWMDKPFLEACMKEGLLDDKTIDIITFHGYHRPTLNVEDRLGEDIEYIRGLIDTYAPAGHFMTLVDSERGVSLMKEGDTRPWFNCTNHVINTTFQAQCLARHYLEEMYHQIELAVWYVYMPGERDFQLYNGLSESDGLIPAGYVYKNLSALLKENSVKLVNNKYEYILSGANSDKLITRSYHSKKKYNRKNDRLFITAWNPVVAAEGKILEETLEVGENKDVLRKFRPVTDNDIVDVTYNITVENIKKVKSVQLFDITVTDFEKGFKKADYEIKGNNLIIKNVTCNAMPSMVIIDL